MEIGAARVPGPVLSLLPSLHLAVGCIACGENGSEVGVLVRVCCCGEAASSPALETYEIKKSLR